jgi:hypothetical protein
MLQGKLKLQISLWEDGPDRALMLHQQFLGQLKQHDFLWEADLDLASSLLQQAGTLQKLWTT